MLTNACKLWGCWINRVAGHVNEGHCNRCGS